jgi:hypothetical protein
MTVRVSSKPADEASRLPAAAWLVLGIVLVADLMDLLDATITTSRGRERVICVAEG